MTASVSNLSLQLMSVSNLLAEQTNLGQLNEQLASGQQYNNLTDYTPTTAQNLMSFQNAVTQKQAYLASMTTVQTRLSLYDQTMTDIEGVASSASTLATSNQTLDPSNVAQLHAQIQTYLQQLTDDLNQQVGGRYIYAGSRYTTPPVIDLSTLTNTPAFPFTATTSPTLPNYDSQYGGASTFTVNSAPTSTANFEISSGGNTYDINWGDLEAGSVTAIKVNGVSTPVTVTGLTTPSGPPLTAAQVANNLKLTVNQLVGNVSGFPNVTAGVSGAAVSLSVPSGTPAVTPDSSGTTGEITWSDGTDGTSAEDLNSSSAAFAQDSVTIDSGFSVQYGVTSNAAAIQQLIAGLQFINEATKSGTSAATYQTDMSNASNILGTATTGLQSLHTGVAYNIDLLTNETNTQNSDITNLQNQLANLQQVNLTQVGTEINVMQSQLQASYSATASLEQLSILKYL